MKTTLLLSATLFAALPALGQTIPTPPSSLPVRQVTLFTSGVAYTERGGNVEGDASVPLLFRTGQINDILKSMVLIDQRGRVQPATYATRDPVGHTLQAFAVDVTSNMTQEQILNKLRGVKVSVETANKPALIGQIVGVEQRQITGEDGKPVTVPFLNLLSDAGLTAIRLDADKTVRLLDERLNREFHEALALLASGSDDQRRQVTLHFSGTGKREVRVGYVLEAPIWKMSYRLLLGGVDSGKPAGAPYLQGWAMVENTSDEDWQNVRLSLVSGRPISFIQDLYQPLYVPRPVVAPDIVASPLPQTNEGDLQEGIEAAKSPQRSRAMGRGTGGTGVGGFGGGGFGGGQGPQGPPAETSPLPPGIKKEDIYAFDGDNSALLRQSVAAQAAGEKVGELFQYNITTPVNLPRQQAALIPVVAQDVEAEKVLLYNADSSRFPLNAVRIHNITSLHLKGGPVTLFDAGVYAGDAKMEDIPPGDSRLLSYAVDVSVEGERQGPAEKTFETRLSIKRGVMTITRRERIETTYTLKSKSDKPRTVLIEHPFHAELKLIAPEKATERTASLYRFAVTLAPGKSQTLKVLTEQPLSETVALLDSDLNMLVAFAGGKEITPALHAALQEVVQRRRHVQELRQQAAARLTEVQSINADQERIRKNMGALDRASILYKRYVGELDAQETHIESLRLEATRLSGLADAAQNDLRAYLDSLNVEDSVAHAPLPANAGVLPL